MESNPEAKSYRLMVIYTQLQKGGILSKTALAQEFGVSERSIQRDIESLRCFLAEQAMPQEIILDRQAGGYRLITKSPSAMSIALTKKGAKA